MSTYNTFASFTHTQHSTHFVVNNTTTCTLSRTTTPEYITYNNNLSLLIKDTNTIPYNFSLNINLNLHNILEYKLVPLAVVQIPVSNLLFEHNSVFINITYKPILAECAFPATITYTKRHGDSNIRSIFKSPSPKTDIITITYNTSLGTINSQYGRKNFLSDTINTCNTEREYIVNALVEQEKLRNIIPFVSYCNINAFAIYAPQFGCVELVPLLLVYGTNPNVKTDNGKTILHSGAESGNIDLVYLLVAHGVDVNAKDNWHNNVLYYAFISRNLNLVQFLVKNGADVNAKTANNATVLHYAAGSSNLDLICYLVQCGIDINAKTTNNETVLYFAAECGSLDLISYLVKNGADVNAKTTNNETVLHFAVRSGNYNLVYWLIEKGTDMHAKTDHNETVLHFAVKSDNLDLVYWLIEKGADIYAKTTDNKTLLHYAVISENYELIYWLIEQGTDINAKTTDNKTVLYYAVILGNYDLVYWLIEQGADINVKTTDNKTVLYYALEYDYFDIVKVLIQCGIDIASDIYNSTCHNYLFDCIQYTNTIPQQSILEDDQTGHLQQYKKNTSVNLKIDKFSNQPESLDISKDSKVLSNKVSNNILISNQVMDITLQSSDDIQCHNMKGIHKSIDDTKISSHSLEKNVQFYTDTPYYYRYTYKEYYQYGSIEYNSYRYQNAILYYEYAINSINHTNYKEYNDEEKHYIIKLLGNIYVDKGNALCMQYKYDEGIVHYHSALSIYDKLIGQDNIGYLIALAKYNFGSAMLKQAIDQYKKGDHELAKAYYDQTLELYKPAEKYGLCNVDELQKEILDNYTIKNNYNYISTYNYSNTDTLYTNMLGEIMVNA